MNYQINNFCNNLRGLRKLSKLTQEELAALLNIRVNDLQNIENGYVPDTITMNILFDVSNIFGIHAHLLLDSLFVNIEN